MLIILWTLIYNIFVVKLELWKPYVFPSPKDVFLTLEALIKDKTLFFGIISSLQRLIIGFGISLIIGVVLGVIIVRYEYLRENVRDLVLGLQTLPSVAWIPFSILWFGLSEVTIIFVIAIGSTFAIAIATEDGIKNVNPQFLKAAKTMGIKGQKLYFKVVLPAALPMIVSGMKQGWSFAWRALMAGEMLVGTKGLGYILMVGRDLADISQVVAVMIVIILLGILIEKLVFLKIESNLREKWGLNKD
jgi:NitT/TauT family transport system permease protein